MLTQKELMEILHYEPSTGEFTWLIRSATHIHVGDKAGTKNMNKYRYIMIDGVSYRTSRLAWLYMEGVFPPQEIDHINTIKSDDRWSNLRLATRHQNNTNQSLRSDNTSGFKGVSRYNNRYLAQIQANGKKKNLGYFSTPEEAHEAYVKAAKELFGEYARTK